MGVTAEAFSKRSPTHLELAGGVLAIKDVLVTLVFMQVMQKMGMKHSPADIEEMIKAAGSDCGKVDREQFLKMVSSG